MPLTPENFPRQLAEFTALLDKYFAITDNSKKGDLYQALLLKACEILKTINLTELKTQLEKLPKSTPSNAVATIWGDEKNFGHFVEVFEPTALREYKIDKRSIDRIQTIIRELRTTQNLEPASAIDSPSWTPNQIVDLLQTTINQTCSFAEQIRIIRGSEERPLMLKVYGVVIIVTNTAFGFSGNIINPVIGGLTIPLVTVSVNVGAEAVGISWPSWFF